VEVVYLLLQFNASVQVPNGEGHMASHVAADEEVKVSSRWLP
jgi:hypothetical protein